MVFDVEPTRNAVLGATEAKISLHPITAKQFDTNSRLDSSLTMAKLNDMKSFTRTFSPPIFLQRRRCILGVERKKKKLLYMIDQKNNNDVLSSRIINMLAAEPQ
jgi:hypothetical protein